MSHSDADVKSTERTLARDANDDDDDDDDDDAQLPASEHAADSLRAVCERPLSGP